MLPSDYFHRQIWLSFVDDPLGIKMIGSILDGVKSHVRLGLSAPGQDLA
jgi:hypothetical protein